MVKNIYIIPGLNETCNEARYFKLAEKLKDKKYKVERISPDWDKPFELFKPKKHSIIIGFSLGAIIAYLISKKYPDGAAIFCSMSPLEKIPAKEINSMFSKTNAQKLKKLKISLDSLSVPHITLAGDKESLIKSDIKVPNTGHFLTRNYINYISELV